jgi:membrane associated rhomboid family serine protease
VSETEAPEPPRLPVAPVVWVIVAALAASFVGLFFAPPEWKNTVLGAFALIPARFDPASPGRFTQWYEYLGPVFGHAFVHLEWWHAGANTFFFFVMARLPALRMGWWRFLVLFFFSAACSAALYIALNWGADHIAIGASGAVCGVFVAYFFSVRRTWREALADPGVRGPLGVIVFVNVVVMGVLAKLNLAPIAWEAHLGGFIGGALAYVALERPLPIRQGLWR